MRWSRVHFPRSKVFQQLPSHISFCNVISPLSHHTYECGWVGGCFDHWSQAETSSILEGNHCIWKETIQKPPYYEKLNHTEMPWGMRHQSWGGGGRRIGRGAWNDQTSRGQSCLWGESSDPHAPADTSGTGDKFLSRALPKFPTHKILSKIKWQL